MIASTVDDVIALLHLGAAEPAGEAGPADSSLLDHHLRCAAKLAEWRRWDVELQVAGLVHDVGHTLTGHDQTNHAAVAARFVSHVLGDRVAALVGLHVAAKRYFFSMQPTVLSRLSAESRQVLDSEGGPLSGEERTRFESSPHYGDALLLHRAEERSACREAEVTGLASWLPALRHHAERVQAGALVT